MPATTTATKPQLFATATRPFTLRFRFDNEVYQIEIDPSPGDETVLDLGEPLTESLWGGWTVDHEAPAPQWEKE